MTDLITTGLAYLLWGWIFFCVFMGAVWIIDKIINY